MLLFYCSLTVCIIVKVNCSVDHVLCNIAVTLGGSVDFYVHSSTVSSLLMC